MVPLHGLSELYTGIFLSVHVRTKSGYGLKTL